MPVTPDDVPVIGRIPSVTNAFINAGHGSKGMALSIGSAKLLRSIVEGRCDPKIEQDYSMNRFAYF